MRNVDGFFPDIDLDEDCLVQSQSVTTKPNHGATDTDNDHSPIPRKTLVPPEAVARKIASTRSDRLSIRQVTSGKRHRARKDITFPISSDLDHMYRNNTKMFGSQIIQIKPGAGRVFTRTDPVSPNNDQTLSASGPALNHNQTTFRVVRGLPVSKGKRNRVSLAINAESGDILAVKTIVMDTKTLGANPDKFHKLAARLRQEIESMQHLEHARLVQYLGFQCDDLSISIYQDYISGGSVGSWLRELGKLEECIVRSLTRQILRGLEYLHDNGVVHRNLTSDNILLDLNGLCKISDFGLTRDEVLSCGEDEDVWDAPEVSQGQFHSPKTDVWSLGCISLEMFAGHRPWSKEDIITARSKRDSQGICPPIPGDVASSITSKAVAFLFDCFAM